MSTQPVFSSVFSGDPEAQSFEITEPLHHEIGIAPRELGGLSQGDLAPGEYIANAVFTNPVLPF